MARVVSCSCKRSYVVAESLAGSSFPCECRQPIELPSLSKMRNFEEVPEPKNGPYQLVDDETRSLEDIKYLKIKFEDAYDALQHTRSTGLVMELLNAHQLASYEVDSVFSKLDRDIRTDRARWGRKNLIIGLIGIPLTTFALIGSFYFIIPKGIIVCGIALIALIPTFVAGFREYSLSKLPNKP